MDDGDAGNPKSAKAGEQLLRRSAAAGQYQQKEKEAAHQWTLDGPGKPMVHSRTFAAACSGGYVPPPAFKGFERRSVVDIFQEVEEDLRAERMRRLAVRYGGPAVGVIILIVGATGAWQGWRWWQGKQRAELAQTYMQAVENAQRQRNQGNAAGVSPPIADLDRLSQTAPESYRSLAGLSLAAVQSERSDRQAALVTWDRIANDAGVRPDLRQLASLMWAAHQPETGDTNQVRARLATLIAAASPWTPLARELLAVQDLREGKQDAAKGELTRVTNGSSVPNGLNGRAASLLARLGGQ